MKAYLRLGLQKCPFRDGTLVYSNRPRKKCWDDPTVILITSFKPFFSKNHQQHPLNPPNLPPLQVTYKVTHSFLPRDTRPAEMVPEQGLKFQDIGEDSSDSGLEYLLD